MIHAFVSGFGYAAGRLFFEVALGTVVGGCVVLWVRRQLRRLKRGLRGRR